MQSNPYKISAGFAAEIDKCGTQLEASSSSRSLLDIQTYRIKNPGVGPSNMHLTSLQEILKLTKVGESLLIGCGSQT